MHIFNTGNFPACILSTQVTFSHAYFCHRWLSHTFFKVAIFPLTRQIFDVFENESHLCRRFTVFVTKYNLMSKVCSKWTCKIISKYMPSTMWIFRTTWLCRCLSRKPVQGANLRPKIKTFQKCIILELTFPSETHSLKLTVLMKSSKLLSHKTNLFCYCEIKCRWPSLLTWVTIHDAKLYLHVEDEKDIHPLLFSINFCRIIKLSNVCWYHLLILEMQSSNHSATHVNSCILHL